MCDTEFLILASDDDVYEPTFLEDINCLTVKYPEVDLFRARVALIDEGGHITLEDMFLDEYETNSDYLRTHFCEKYIRCIANHVF